MAYTQSSCGCTKPEETGNRCPLRKIKSIAKSGDYVIVTFDDCTFLKASFNVVDDTFGGTTLPKLPETDTELKKEVDSLKTKVDKLGSKEDKDTVYDDSALVKRIETLEAKEDKDTIFDPESLIGRIAALEGKEDKDTVYDDTAIRNLIEALQNKEDKDTVFDPSALEARVKALEDAPAGDKVDTTKFVRKDELVDVQNWAGTTRFKAYPADVIPKTVYPEDRL